MPKVVDHDQRRSDVIAATRSVVATEGLDAATMRRIAVEAGCTTGRITHYFADKHEVLVAVLRQVHGAAAERMVNRLASTAPGAEQLRAVLEEALPLDATRLEEWQVWLAFWGRAAGDPDLQTEQHARYREWSSLVGGLLGRAPDHPDVDRVIATVDGIGIRATLDPDAFTTDRQRAAIGQLLASV